MGFTRKNSNAEGQYGLEEYYDNILTGTNGREYGYQNDDDTLERTVKPAIDGYTIHTTIDANIQKIVEKYLKDFNDTHMNAVRTGNGAENLGCIIMDVNSGEILAMANYPDYDPNDYKNITPLIGTQLIEAYTNPAGYIEYETTDTPITQELIYSLFQQDPDCIFIREEDYDAFCHTAPYNQLRAVKEGHAYPIPSSSIDNLCPRNFQVIDAMAERLQELAE